MLMAFSQTGGEAAHHATASEVFCSLCLSCFEGAGADGCINCTEGYFMEDGRCVQSCSISYYFDHSSENGYKSCKK